MRCSIIVPTLNEAAAIEASLRRLDVLRAHEVIVGDGGSEDGTVELARRYAKVVNGRRGRGPQLNAAAAQATGDTFLIVHADVRLPRNALTAVEQALADPGTVGGYFRVRFGRGPHDAFLAAFYDLLRRTGVVYGDACVFVRRATFERMGGFRDYPIMEDVNLVSRMRTQGRVVALPQVVRPSSRRWERDGRWRSWASWCGIMALYGLGVSPRFLGRLYRQVR